MNDLAKQFGLSFLAEPWLPEVLIVTVAVVVLNLGAYYLLRHVEKAASRTPSVWDDALYFSFSRSDPLLSRVELTRTQ